MKFQNEKVTQHIAAGGELYRSLGVGVVLASIGITLLLLFGVVRVANSLNHTNVSFWEVLSLSHRYDRQAYEQKINKFYQVDQLALDFYNQSLDGSESNFLKNMDGVIGDYKSNLALLDEIDAIPNIPDGIKKDDARLRNYTNLRIKLFGLIKQSVAEHSHAYDSQIESIKNQLKTYVQKPNTTSSNTTTNTQSGSGQTVTPSTQVQDYPILVPNQSDPHPQTINY